MTELSGHYEMRNALMRSEGLIQTELKPELILGEWIDWIRLGFGLL